MLPASFVLVQASIIFGLQAVVMVLESKGDTASPAIIKLLQTFWKIGLITVDQMNRVGSCTCER